MPRKGPSRLTRSMLSMAVPIDARQGRPSCGPPFLSSSPPRVPSPLCAPPPPPTKYTPFHPTLCSNGYYYLHLNPTSLGQCVSGPTARLPAGPSVPSSPFHRAAHSPSLATAVLYVFNCPPALGRWLVTMPFYARESHGHSSYEFCNVHNNTTATTFNLNYPSKKESSGAAAEQCTRQAWTGRRGTAARCRRRSI